jgi:adenosylhomocysteine nucleosidase
VESNKTAEKSSAQKATTLVCFAVKEEAAPFLKFTKNNPGVSVLVTGMGRKNSERALLQSLPKTLPGLVLTCGFAGALDPRLKIGDVVYEADAESRLAPALQEAGAAAAKFHCAARVATTIAEKTALRKSTGADVVEMESQFIRQLCRERKIPSATLRAISDSALDDLPLDFNELMTEDDTLSFSKLTIALMKSPGKIPQLMQLQKNTRLAAQKLAEVLEKLLSDRSR